MGAGWPQFALGLSSRCALPVLGDGSARLGLLHPQALGVLGRHRARRPCGHRFLGRLPHNLLENGERPLCVFESNGKCYVYLRPPFGLASAPLAWCRLAAAAFRLTQAMAASAECESHCYVDEPGMAMAGRSACSRKRSLSLVLLLSDSLSRRFQGKAIPQPSRGGAACGHTMPGVRLLSGLVRCFPLTWLVWGS